MKISKERIAEIIKEEVSLALSEYSAHKEDIDFIMSEKDLLRDDETKVEYEDEDLLKSDEIISEVNRWLNLAGIDLEDDNEE